MGNAQREAPGRDRASPAREEGTGAWPLPLQKPPKTNVI